MHVVELCGSLDLHGLADRLCRSPSGSAAILIQSERNLSKLCQDCIKSKICLNCNRMANIRNCDAVGWIAKDEIIDCIRIVTTQESVFWGSWGTERIVKNPQASVWACPRVRAQTRQSAVRLGLIANHSWNPQFCMDCPSIGQIEPRLHCSHNRCSSVAFHSIALGLPPFVQSRCNRDW